MVKVCQISTVHNLHDHRILYKECASLVKFGFDVSLVIQAEKVEVINGVKIVSLKITTNRLYRIFCLTWIAFFKALKTKSKIYHFHDPELLLLAPFFKLMGKKVIFDSHEDVVSQLLYKPYLKSNILKQLVSFAFRIFQSFISLFLDKIIVVTDLMIPRFNPKKTVVISNFPLINELENQPSIKKHQELSFVYAGGLFRVRNIKEIVLGYAALSHKTSFHILGAWDTKAYETECKSMPAWKDITYYGKVSFQKAQEIIAASHIGILILKPTPNHLLSMPIKAFEYMYNELPFIASDFPYWKNLFAECAIFVNPDNIEETTKAMKLLLEDADLRNKLAKAGKKLVLEKYNWNKEELKLNELYTSLIKK